MKILLKLESLDLLLQSLDVGRLDLQINVEFGERALDFLSEPIDIFKLLEIAGQ